MNSRRFAKHQARVLWAGRLPQSLAEQRAAVFADSDIGVRAWRFESTSKHGRREAGRQAARRGPASAPTNQDPVARGRADRVQGEADDKV